MRALHLGEVQNLKLYRGRPAATGRMRMARLWQCRIPMTAPLIAVEQLVLAVRAQRVILGSDLAKVYGVAPRVLNQAVKRHADRFPSDFAFRLTREEVEAVLRSRSQSVILNRGRNIKYLPLAFTEHGAIMAAAVLNSARAIQMSLFVVRAFLRLRELVAGQVELAAHLAELERRVGAHDSEIQTIIQAVRRLVEPVRPSRRRRIGFAVR